MLDFTVGDAERAQSCSHGLGLRVEHAGEYQTPAGRAEERGQQRQDYVRRQVGASYVRRSGRVVNRADAETYPTADAVQTRVLFGYADGERVRVARLHARLRRELRGGDGEYPCAPANVEEASAAELFFPSREAQAP